MTKANLDPFEDSADYGKCAYCGAALPPPIRGHPLLYCRKPARCSWFAWFERKIESTVRERLKLR